MNQDSRPSDGAPLAGRVPGALRQASWQAECELAGLSLKSSFQAIHDMEGESVIAHSARVRAWRDGAAVPIAELFDPARSDADIVRIDRLCRVLHATNYHAEGVKPTRLLVPAHPRLLQSVTADHGRVYREALDGIGLTDARTVIALPDPANLRTMSLVYLMGSYRLHGFEIAVNLAHASGLADLLARTRPNYVLLDVRQCGAPDSIAAAIAIAAQAGTRVVFTMVESAGAAQRIRAAGGSLGQGYYFDKRPAGIAA